MSGFLMNKDESNINKDGKIDTHLPVHTPYWSRKTASDNKTTSQFGQPGVRATWIGHATVLAEVDEAIVLCDPIFRFVDKEVLKNRMCLSPYYCCIT